MIKIKIKIFFYVSKRVDAFEDVFFCRCCLLRVIKKIRVKVQSASASWSSWASQNFCPVLRNRTFLEKIRILCVKIMLKLMWKFTSILIEVFCIFISLVLFEISCCQREVEVWESFCIYLKNWSCYVLMLLVKLTKWTLTAFRMLFFKEKFN